MISWLGTLLALGIPTPSELLDLMLFSSPSLPMTPSHIHAFQGSLGYLRGSHPSIDPYCAYLENVPEKSCGVFSLIMLFIFL